MKPSPNRFTGSNGAVLAVRSATGADGNTHTVALNCDPDGGGPNVFIPAHKLAEVVAAMYEAAGQPVPMLPVIVDQMQAVALARLLHYACCGDDDAPDTGELSIARKLLARGVTVPEPTP